MSLKMHDVLVLLKFWRCFLFVSPSQNQFRSNATFLKLFSKMYGHWNVYRKIRNCSIPHLQKIAFVRLKLEEKPVVASLAIVNINPLNLFYLAWICYNPKKTPFFSQTMYCKIKWLNCYQQYKKELIQFA